MTKDEALKLALEALEDRTSLMKWQMARDSVKEALAQPMLPQKKCLTKRRKVMSDKTNAPSYWFANTDSEGAGPTYVVGRGDEELTRPCLFQDEAKTIVNALNTLQNLKGEK